jgi:antiviral helicase SLH1
MREEVERVAGAVGVKANAMARVQKALSQLPDLNIKVEDATALGFVVHIQRSKPLELPGGRMYAPAFPKPQTEGFFLLVTRSGTDELIALKRINWPSADGGRRDRWKVKSTVKVPEDVREGKVDVAVLSDGYIGMQWLVQGIEIPAAPVVQDTGKKEHE